MNGNLLRYKNTAHPEGPTLSVRKEETEAHTAGLTNCRAEKRQPMSAGTESATGEGSKAIKASLVLISLVFFFAVTNET